MYSRVYVEITNICNMRCSFCHGHSRGPRQMTREEFSHILEQLAGHTGYIYYHLMGEPLTHPELPAFLAMAKQRGFRSVITTNGTLLRRHGQALLDAGIHKVSISMHSFEKDDPEAHLDYIRQVADFAAAAAASGIIVVLRFWNNGCEEEKNAHALSLLRQLLSGDWSENSRGIRVRDRLFVEWGERFQWPDKAAPIQGEKYFCYGLRDHFGILCDGTVVPCCLDSEGVIPLGNIFRQPIGEILDSPRAKAMVAGFSCQKATEALCRRCGYAQRFV